MSLNTIEMVSIKHVFFINLPYGKSIMTNNSKSSVFSFKNPYYNGKFIFFPVRGGLIYSKLLLEK